MSDDQFPAYGLAKGWQDRLDPPQYTDSRSAAALLILVVCVMAMVVCLIVSPTL